MKRYFALTALTLTICSLTPAQEPQRVVIPARNSSRPRLVKASLPNAGIVVRTHTGTDVIVEASGGGSRHREERSRDGLRRIDMPYQGFTAEEDNNVITIRTDGSVGGVLTVTVPTNTSVELTCHNGPITVDGLTGEVVLSSQNGRIVATNISGTIVADSKNGPITASMNRVDPAKPISFTTENGSVEVTLPADLKANLKMRANNGSIWTDYDMTISSGNRPITTGGGSNARFEVRFDRTMYGTVNGGGVEANFSTINGKIVIKKK
jgi:hypothetical protein